MDKPECPQKSPYVLDAAPGDYWWCACGKSSKQPFCDGAHKGSGVVPVKVTIDAGKMVAWCGCKATGGAPFCDGSHREL